MTIPTETIISIASAAGTGLGALVIAYQAHKNAKIAKVTAEVAKAETIRVSEIAKVAVAEALKVSTVTKKIDHEVSANGGTLRDFMRSQAESDILIRQELATFRERLLYIERALTTLASTPTSELLPK